MKRLWIWLMLPVFSYASIEQEWLVGSSVPIELSQELRRSSSLVEQSNTEQEELADSSEPIELSQELRRSSSLVEQPDHEELSFPVPKVPARFTRKREQILKKHKRSKIRAREEELEEQSLAEQFEIDERSSSEKKVRRSKKGKAANLEIAKVEKDAKKLKKRQQRTKGYEIESELAQNERESPVTPQPAEKKYKRMSDEKVAAQSKNYHQPYAKAREKIEAEIQKHEKQLASLKRSEWIIKNKRLTRSEAEMASWREEYSSVLADED